jgi:hypothetical protein
VEAPSTGVSKGAPVTITGTVTDQSEGQKDTPAISDADMGSWMEYLKMQQPMPTNAKGVPVALTAVDPSGITVTIGEVTSDIGGSYGISWTPTLEGRYQIMATFGGTDSYGSSYATTYLTVGPALASTGPSTASSAPIDLYIIAATVVILIAIAIATIAIRKR